MVTRTGRTCLVIAVWVALALAPRAHAAFTYTKYVGTYVLQDGRAETITLQIDHATKDGWEGHATIGCKGCESMATATSGWTITVFALDRNFEKRVIAQFIGTLSADGKTLSGPIVKDGVRGVAILTAE